MRTYGTIRHSPKYWVIEAEPHVVIRLKRLFPRISKKQHGRLSIAKNPETAREIEWFLQRYPMEFAKESTRWALASAATEHREQEAIVDQILKGTREARPFDMALPAREYQRLAADMLLATGGLLLADELGLGKTCSAIAALTDPRTRPALVVTLTHLPKQWQAELKKFAPQLTTHIIKKGTPYDLTAPDRRRMRRNGQKNLFDARMPDVIICNYHKLSGWAETLAKVVKSVVWDEGQELRRGEESQKGAAAYHIARSVDFRMSLTGTPIYNYGGEMWNVMNAVKPGALGTWAEFASEWCRDDTERRKAKVANPRAFGTYLRETGLMLRRTRSEVGRELPELTRVPHYVDCDTEWLDNIETAATELAKTIMTQNPMGRGDKFRAAENLSNMVRQATGIAKSGYVAEFVKIIAQSEPVLLYGWHRAVYDIWLERLRDLNPVLFTGSESPAQKERAKEAFLSGKSQVLIMSLRAGAGIDGLQEHCRTVAFGEFDWSSGVHEQAEGRIYRDGQKEKVVAYYLESEEGSDPLIMDVLGVKREQLAGMRDPKADLLYKLQTDSNHIRKLAESYLARRRGA